MNSADLITSFFNNELSPDQEREFLVSVASSDAMRLGLKSHVMLDKILIEENQNVEISPAVRRSILKEAAVVAAGLGGLSGEALAATDATTAEATTAEAAASGGESGGFFGSWMALPATLLVALGSFFLGYSVAEEGEDAAATPMTVAVDEKRDAFKDPARPFFTVPQVPALLSSAIVSNPAIVPEQPVAVVASTSATSATTSGTRLPTEPVASATTDDDRPDENASKAPEGPNHVDPGKTSVNKGQRTD